MTKLYDDPASFSDDLLAGFLDVYAGRVVGVPGGVVRVTETPPGKVAVVVGGGSGHYPAFCGWLVLVSRMGRWSGTSSLPRRPRRPLPSAWPPPATPGCCSVRGTTPAT